LPTYHLGDFRAARAHQTKESEDLADAEFEAHVFDKRGARQTENAERGLSDRSFLFWEETARFSANHVPDGLLDAQARSRPCNHPPA
jgi:hypothetical protein